MKVLEREERSDNVINLMDALRQSLKGSKVEAPVAKNGKSKKRVEGQREMLLPITGKAGKEEKKRAERSADNKQRKAG